MMMFLDVRMEIARKFVVVMDLIRASVRTELAEVPQSSVVEWPCLLGLVSSFPSTSLLDVVAYIS